MHAADADAPRIETAVEFCSGMGVETAMQVVDTCPERMYAGALAMRRFFWRTRKKRNKKKQELKAAGEC